MPRKQEAGNEAYPAARAEAILPLVSASVRHTGIARLGVVRRSVREEKSEVLGGCVASQCPLEGFADGAYIGV
jgi:hypothetical protein